MVREKNVFFLDFSFQIVLVFLAVIFRPGFLDISVMIRIFQCFIFGNFLVLFCFVLYKIYGQKRETQLALDTPLFHVMKEVFIFVIANK